MNTVFGENLGKIIALKELTQEGLADDSGIKRQTINKAIQISINNNHNIKIKTAIALAKGLNVDFPKLFSRLTNEDIKNMGDYIEDDYLDVFVQNVKRSIRIRGKKQKALSSDPGAKEATVSEILNHKVSDPYLSSIISISEILNVDIELLLRRGGLENDF